MLLTARHFQTAVATILSLVVEMLKNVAQHNEINFTNAISSLSLSLTRIVVFRLAEFNLKE
jgi:hypothetical protein